MKQHNPPTLEDFDALLNWLDEDRDKAGQKYESIRRRLIEIFRCRGCLDAGELADETINRVAAKVSVVSKDYNGDPALYFYGVARIVFLESVRRPAPGPKPVPPDDPERLEDLDRCLDECLGTFSSGDRDLLLRYFDCDKQTKIRSRQQLAEKLGIAQGALRIRVHRLKGPLKQCVKGCLERLGT